MERFNWEKKRVLVTGAGGFIGSHLTEHLVKLDAQVRAMVHYNSFGRCGWLDNLDIMRDVEVFKGDVTDRDSMRKAIKGQEIVFHLAALIGIPYSYEAVNSYVQTNIIGTLNILHITKEEEVGCIIHMSSSEAYGTAQYAPIDENHPMLAQSPYSATKISSDQLALSFYRSFGTPIKIARPFNTYGPRQSARAIIPTVITQILSGKKKIKLGNLSPKRDFTYVKDIVRGLTELAKSKKLIGEITNLGSNNEISIGNLAKLIASLMNKKIEIIEDIKRIRTKDSEVERLRCDYTKMKKATHWEPQYDLKSGLKETIKWFEGNLGLYKADSYSI